MPAASESGDGFRKGSRAAALVWLVEAVSCWAGAVVAGAVGLDAICWLLSATTSDAAGRADVSTGIFTRPGGALGGAGGLRHGKFSKYFRDLASLEPSFLLFWGANGGPFSFLAVVLFMAFPGLVTFLELFLVGV